MLIPQDIMDDVVDFKKIVESHYIKVYELRKNDNEYTYKVLMDQRELLIKICELITELQIGRYHTNTCLKLIEYNKALNNDFVIINIKLMLLISKIENFYYTEQKCTNHLGKYVKFIIYAVLLIMFFGTIFGLFYIIFALN